MLINDITSYHIIWNNLGGDFLKAFRLSEEPEPHTTKGGRSFDLKDFVLGSGSSDSLKAFRKSPPKLFHMIW